MNRFGPYVSVICDSFHAAFASRVLWVAFASIWLLIAAILPIGYREDYTTVFRDYDIENGGRLKAMLARGIADPEQTNTAVGRIASALPEDVKRELQQVGKGEDVRFYFYTLSDALNKLFEDESWYDAEAWNGTIRLRELRELDKLSESGLDDSLRRRRVRLRIEAALPGVFESRSARSVILTYMGVDFPAKFAVDKTQFLILLNQFVIPTIINWLLGFILVFLGILVTASIVPDMLQPGSLHLLLSKPISRSMLLISKFVGGCAFVFLCVVQLIVGLYFVAGLRLDVWNPRLLLCIPVSVFVFAVYYSVSMLAGLRWRSPILAIGITCLFAACLVVLGVIGGLFDVFVVRPDTIDHITLLREDLFVTTRGEGLLKYDPNSGGWEAIYESDALGRDRVLAPVVLSEASFATAVVRGGRHNPFGLGGFDLMAFRREKKWRPEPSLRLPTATTRLIQTDGQLFAVNTSGVAGTTQAEIFKRIEPNENSSALDDSGNAPAVKNEWMEKITSMMGAPTSGFNNVLPRDFAFVPPRGIAIDHDGDRLLVLSGKQLTQFKHFSPNDDTNDNTNALPSPWTVAAERSVDRDEIPQFGLIAYGDSSILLATDKGALELLDASTLMTKATHAPPRQTVVLSILALGRQDRFALLTSDERCRILEWDESSKTFHVSRTLPQKEIESIGYDHLSSMFLVAHHVDQIDFLDGKTFKLKREVRPKRSAWRLIHRFLITPLQLVTPQTGELGGTVASIVSGESSVELNREESGSVDLVRYRIVTPIVSCSVFIILMLSVGCFYFTRNDF